MCVFFFWWKQLVCLLLACYFIIMRVGRKKIYMRVDGGRRQQQFFFISRGKKRKIIKLAKHFFLRRAYLARLYVHMYYVVRLKSSLTCCLLEQIFEIYLSSPYKCEINNISNVIIVKNFPQMNFALSAVFLSIGLLGH